MRSKLAKRIVRYVSQALDNAYHNNCKNEKAIEEWWARKAKRRQKLFPVAKWLDREAMTTQMIEECWWG